MLVDNTNVHVTLTTSGENIIACKSLKEVFFNVFEIQLNEKIEFLKPLHRRIQGAPIVAANVTMGDTVFENVEFKVVESNAVGIFLNQRTLANGGIIEHADIPEDVHQVAQLIEQTIDDVAQEQAFDAAAVKQQIIEQKEQQLENYLNKLDKKLVAKIDEDLLATKQSILAETLAIQSSIEKQAAKELTKTIEGFKQKLNQWAEGVEKHLVEYADEAIEDAQLQFTEKSAAMLEENKTETMQLLQQQLAAAVVDGLSSAKQKIFEELQMHLSQCIQESNNTIQTLIKQHQQLQQNINAASTEQSANFAAMTSELNKIVSETSSDVAYCLKNADDVIQDKVQNAVKQINEMAQHLHQERMQGIEQNLATILRENLADDQPQVITEARASVRNALESYKRDLSKDLNAQMVNIQKELYSKLQLYIQSYAGGGSVAMQFADGGTMNGTLNVATGQILSAGVDLASIFSGGGGGGDNQTLSFNESTAALTISNGNTVSLSALSGGNAIATGNYLPLTGGIVTGGVTVTGTLSTTTLYATSAFVTIVDITQYELSGFNVTGNVTVNGQMSATTMATNFIDFTPLSAAPIHVDGRLYYDQTEQTLVFWDGDPTLKYPINKMLWTIGVNKTGSIIPKGTVVYLSGAQGNRGKMWPALATADLRSADTIGVTMQATAINQEGYIMAIGELEGIDTRAFAEGTTLYLSPTAAGGITDVKPQAPNHIVKIGFSLNSTVNGKIYVEIDNGYELDELHNVGINGVANGQGLIYNSTSALWVNSDLYNGADLKALSANWQNTYTNFSTQSANNISTYSTVQANSAQWAIDSTIDTGVRALTGNWQITYTIVQSNSAVWNQTAYLPLSGGTLTGAVSTNQDIEITDSTKGIILTSPSNFKYRVTVNDAGELITTLV